MEPFRKAIIRCAALLVAVLCVSVSSTVWADDMEEPELPPEAGADGESSDEDKNMAHVLPKPPIREPEEIQSREPVQPRP